MRHKRTKSACKYAIEHPLRSSVVAPALSAKISRRRLHFTHLCTPEGSHISRTSFGRSPPPRIASVHRRIALGGTSELVSQPITMRCSSGIGFPAGVQVHFANHLNAGQRKRPLSYVKGEETKIERGGARGGIGQSSVTAVEWMPDGQKFLSAGQDGLVKVSFDSWTAFTHRRCADLQAHSQWKFNL